MSVRIRRRIAFGNVLAIALVLTLVGPCSSDQGDISGLGDVPSLSGIWSIEGLEEVCGVVIALEQNGSELYGRAKCEPDGGWGWNGQVIGSVAGEEIELVIASGQDGAPVSSRVIGKFINANQSIVGDFIQTSKGQVMKKGSFVAIAINPDTSLYSPATIGGVGSVDSKGVTEHIAEKKAPGDGKSLSNLTYPAKKSGPNQTMQNDGITDSRYYDVHGDEESILTGICSPGPTLS